MLLWFGCELDCDPFLGRLPTGLVCDVLELALDRTGGKSVVQGGDGSMADRAVILAFRRGVAAGRLSSR